MQLGSLRLPAGGGVGEEQEEWRTPYHPSSREQKNEREAEGVGSMNGKDPVRALCAAAASLLPKPPRSFGHHCSRYHRI